MSRKRVVWVIGCREGSNLTARYLRACGAALPIVEPRPGNAWNEFWAEDNRVLTLATRVFGLEPAIPVQRQWRPPADGPGWDHVPELVEHFRANATGPLTVFKFGCLPHVWPEIQAAMPDAEYRHVLVSCHRPVADRLGSLKRLNPDATDSDLLEFLDRHSRSRAALVDTFQKAGRTVVYQPLARQALADTARRLGLEPTAEAEALWRERPEARNPEPGTRSPE